MWDPQFFKSMDISVRKKEISKLEMGKENWQKMESNEKEMGCLVMDVEKTA